ncbi:MAG: hypothetical protein C4K48_06705 [Candidatus Thorarchaeota archaeon]|nr:MAG: hypothetical protein C4K48_06705 [Candidatus Thorarchaeota archaeon]
MDSAPVTTRSTGFYQVLLFIVLQISAIMIYDVAQYQMVTLYETPLEWIGWASLFFLILIPATGLISWKLKGRVQLGTIRWEYRTREVGLSEFTQMVKDYNKSYRYMIAALDYRILPLLPVLYFGALFLPFLLMRTSLLVILMTPVIIALLLVMFGSFYAYLVFKLVSNSATHEFPTHKPRVLQSSVKFLSHVPGVYWSGVRVTIGESGGFYTLRDPCSVARIEGIEGAARIECVVDNTGNISSMASLLESEKPDSPLIVGKVDAPLTTMNAAQLIRKTLQVYIESRGGEDILDDVLQEVDAFLEGVTLPEAQGISNDGLISSGDKGPPAEERT